MKRGFRDLLGRASTAALASLLFLITIVGGCAQSAAAAEPARVIAIHNELWDSSLLVSCDDPDGCTIELSTCPVGPVPTLTLTAGESRVIPDIKSYQCVAGDAAVIPLKITSGQPHVSTAARLQTALNVVSLELPTVNYSAALGGRIIQNDDEFDTSVALFSESADTRYITAVVIDGSNHEAGSQVVSIAPGFNFFQLTPRVSEGRLEIRGGTSGFGCGACSEGPSVAGVAFVNWRAGGSARVVPLTPINP